MSFYFGPYAVLLLVVAVSVLLGCDIAHRPCEVLLPEVIAAFLGHGQLKRKGKTRKLSVASAASCVSQTLVCGI
jgi:hypothetical protein